MCILDISEASIGKVVTRQQNGRAAGEVRRHARGLRNARSSGRYWDRTSDLLGVNEALSR
jgi:hypothetical protein